MERELGREGKWLVEEAGFRGKGKGAGGKEGREREGKESLAMTSEKDFFFSSLKLVHIL